MASSIPPLPLTGWSTIAGFVRGIDDRRSLRLVSSTCRQAVDNTTRHLTVVRTRFQSFPEFSRFLWCTCIQLVDDLESPPSFKLARFLGSPPKSAVLFVVGEWWWERKDLRLWALRQQQRDPDLKVGLMVCIREGNEGQDIADNLVPSLDLPDSPPLSFLGLWPQCMEGVLVTDELRWCRHIPCLDKLQGLYLEFVYLDARVLSKMCNLRELRLLFDQWEVAHLEVFAQLPTLETLYLEPATPNALPVEVLFGLGQHIRTLKLQGRMSALAVSGHPSWAELLPALFADLSSLEAFEASINAVDLVEAAEKDAHSRRETALQLRAWRLHNFKGIWVAIDKKTHAFRGGYRTIEAAKQSEENTLQTDTD